MAQSALSVGLKMGLCSLSLGEGGLSFLLEYLPSLSAVPLSFPVLQLTRYLLKIRNNVTENLTIIL